MASLFTMLLLVSAVCPVAMRAIRFCTIWSWLKLVVEMIGAHVVLAYSNMGCVIDLYVWINVSLFFPHEVPVSAL